MTSGHSAAALTAIKLLHTAVWAVMAFAILSLPVCAQLARYDYALVVIVLVLLEVAALLSNRGRCPLTNLAARFTEDRSDNFDIYLPRWLARHNKTIFGALFLAGCLFVGWRWMTTATGHSGFAALH